MLTSEHTRRGLPFEGGKENWKSPLSVHWSASSVLILAIFGALLFVPVLSYVLGHTYYMDVVSRMMILGLAAVGLNIALGYGGMVSFGHALYLGIGAYAVGVMSAHGIDSGLLHLIAALIIGTAIAIIVGHISLKTSGMAFIMITLAFTQMFYFLAISLKQYGGDDGLPIATRSVLPGLDLNNPYQFYALVFVGLSLAVYLSHRLVRSRFGMVLRGCKQNSRRVYALGFPANRYKLTAYVISAQIVLVAGVLLGNLALFASPSYLSWALSGDLILMCVLGGLGTLVGPLVGAIAFVGLEEFLSTMPIELPGQLSELVMTHWLGFFGVFIVLVVLFLRRGLYGAFVKEAHHD